VVELPFSQLIKVGVVLITEMFVFVSGEIIGKWPDFLSSSSLLLLLERASP
jgi:hypothetical protein